MSLARHTHDSRLVTQSDLSRLHDQGQAGVDAVRSLLALLWCHLEASGTLDCREMCLVIIFLKRLCSPAVLDGEEDMLHRGEFVRGGLGSAIAGRSIRQAPSLGEDHGDRGMSSLVKQQAGTRTTSAIERFDVIYADRQDTFDRSYRSHVKLDLS